MLDASVPGRAASSTPTVTSTTAIGADTNTSGVLPGWLIMTSTIWTEPSIVARRARSAARAKDRPQFAFARGEAGA